MNRREVLSRCLALAFASGLLAGCPDRDERPPETGSGRGEPVERRPRVEAPPFESKLRSPEDGQGTARVDPSDPVPAGTPGTWTVTYVAGDAGIATSGGINVVISAYWGWTEPQSRSPEYPGYCTFDTDAADAELTLETTTHQIFVRVKKGRLACGETVSVTYGDTGEGKFPGARARCDRFAESREEFHVRVDGDGDGFYASLPYGQQPWIEILGREAVRLALVGPSFARVGEPARFAVSALDALDNRATGFEETIEIHLPDSVLEGAPSSLAFEAADRAAKSFEVRFGRPGVHEITVDLPGPRKIEVTSNPVLVTEETPAFGLYWGDLQGHSGLCDGSGTPDDYYSYGRDVARLDFCALTTHDAWGLYMMDEVPGVYEDGRDATRRFHAPGSYVTFLGYEYTNWTSGHKHVLFPGDEGPVISYRSEEGKTPDRLWEALEGTGAVTISHHPGGGPIGQDWSYHDPAMEPVVEMVSIHGSSEYFGCPRMIHRPEKGGFAQDALARGYRLGFIGSGDTHNGHPGMGDRQSPTGGVAAVYARDLTRESILDALRARRTYATSGPRIILTFSVEEWIEESGGAIAWMGSRLEIPSPDTPRALRATAIGVGPIASIDLVKNSRTVMRNPGEGREVHLALEDREPARSGDHYYVRVTQEDGEQAWSSPVWIEVVP